MSQHARILALALAVVLLALAALFAGLAARESSRVYTELVNHSDLIRYEVTGEAELMLKSTVTDPDGDVIEVTTIAGQGIDPNGQAVPTNETAQQLLARHKRWIRFIEGEES